MKTDFSETISFLSNIINKAKENLEKAPEGSLSVSKNKDCYEFYHYVNGKSNYISHTNKDLIYRLAQKEYDKRVLKEAEFQRKIIKKFSSQYDSEALLTIFDNLHPCKKEMVKPYEISTKEKIEIWKNEKYERLPFSDNQFTYLTSNGEHVRSKSEVIIAETLSKFKIPYKYECPLNLTGYGNIHPDFTVMNIRTGKKFIFEHFGRVGDEDYEKTMNKKLELYAQNGYFFGENLIYTFETSTSPLNIKYLEQLIKHFFT